MTLTPLPPLPLFPGFDGLDNPALTAALEALPGYDQHQAATVTLRDALSTANEALLEATTRRATFVAGIVGTALAGKPLPGGLAKQAVDTERSLADARAVVSALTDAGQQLTEGREQLLSSAPAALAEHLDAQLQRALGEARALDLGSIRTAQAAIDAGKVDQWQRYLDLNQVHEAIRSAQRQAAANLSRWDLGGQQHLDTFGAVRNYADLFPQWVLRSRREPIEFHNGVPIYPTPPWGDDEDAAHLWSYAVENPEVDLWVPTTRQLLDAFTAASAEASSSENADPVLIAP